MRSRAMGKALGRFRSGLPRCRVVAKPAAAVALWALGAGLGGQSMLMAEPLPAFHQMEPGAAKKLRFFAYLIPVVQAENERIRRQRQGLRDLASARAAGEPFGWRRTWFLNELAREYRVSPQHHATATLIEALLIRVDIVPHSLVLAQAAKESGWGSSRLARRANNLFGQWCFDPGCGVVPRERPSGMSHEVRSFDSVRHSVASYMRNLNTHDGYRRLRSLRAELRAQSRPLSGLTLAEGLTRYSERGDDYVREVQLLIRQNALEPDGLTTLAAGS